WNDAGLRPDGERGTEAQRPGHPRLRSESHVGPAQVVRGFEVVENFGTSRLVYLARRQSSRRTAQQLALHVWAFRLEARPEDESVLLPLLLSGAAGLELAESGGGESHAGRDALLVQARRGRIPPGRRGHSFRGSEAYGQSGPAGHGQVWAAEHGGEVRQETAGSTRRDAQIAQCGGRVWFRADRRNVDLQRFGAEGLLRRTQRRTAAADGPYDDGVQRAFRGSIPQAHRRRECRRPLARLCDHQSRHRAFVHTLR